MVQQLNVRTGNGTKQVKTPWVSIILSIVFVCLPPIAIWAMGRDATNNGHPRSVAEYLVAGIIFTGAFLFPILSFGALVLAFANGLKRTVTSRAKVTLWALFVVSVLNCGVVISFFSEHINK
jgi:hypothetical protein